jgi:hypothetical protein
MVRVSIALFTYIIVPEILFQVIGASSAATLNQSIVTKVKKIKIGNNWDIQDHSNKFNAGNKCKFIALAINVTTLKLKKCVYFMAIHFL